jgi:DNA-binding HxlR family transcriptional regulator
VKQVVHPVCSRFHEAIELIGGRWTGAIIQTLLRGPARYAGIRAAVPDISDRMLCERLRALEGEGVVARRVFPETPVRVEYELTHKGQSLDRALDAIARWAEEWIPAPASSTPGEPGASTRVPAQTGKPRIKPRIPA